MSILFRILTAFAITWIWVFIIVTFCERNIPPTRQYWRETGLMFLVFFFLFSLVCFGDIILAQIRS